MNQMKELLERVQKKNVKFIVVTGGVCSSIGKGVLTSSIGVLIKNAGASISVVKWDPYLNVDPGTMSPLVHGEVFVTEDGAETDLDLGHYERMIDIRLTKDSSVSSGQIFQEILEGERKGIYLGKCIQLVPHVVDAIKRRLLNFADNAKAEFILVEIGGTVGDMEGEIFLEAIRQLRLNFGAQQMFHCHLSYVPYLDWANEIKTKPTQHSVMLLKKVGLIPDALFLRAEQPTNEKIIKKVSIMCGVRKNLIFEVLTRKPIYRLFLDLKQQQLYTKIQEWFSITPHKDTDLSAWEDLLARIEKEKPTITIGLVAKYVGSSDPYISVVEAIKSAAYACDRNVDIIAIDAQKLEEKEKDTADFRETMQKLTASDGIVLPGGFDKRGIAGKLVAAQWAREHKVPYLGLCLGLQVMLIECARSLLKLKEASSTEFERKTAHPVISLLDEQRGVVQKGGSMRLGSFVCSLKRNTKAWEAYKKNEVSERHRHRYEFNNEYRAALEDVGVVFSGINKERDLVEIAEIIDHPFMLGTQFHPEFQSSSLQPHPLFKAFIEAVISK